MCNFAKAPLWAPILLILAGVAAARADAMQSKTVADYRVELHVLPVEPFFSKQDVADKHIKDGMEIEGGAAPVPPDAASHPNHHLVVHIFRSGAVVTDAKVTMSFVAIDAGGKPAGAPTDVPVVVMQAIGGGANSTHYGNNVTMPPGHYSVVVMVDGQKAMFDVTASDTPPGSMGGMGGMKM